MWVRITRGASRFDIEPCDRSPVDLPLDLFSYELVSVHAPLCNCGSMRLSTCAMFKIPTGDTDSGASAAAPTESLVCDYSTALSGHNDINVVDHSPNCPPEGPGHVT